MIKYSVTVGIAAYNAENNIKKLINSLLIQKEKHFVLDEIIVHSDNSSDSTCSISRSIKSDKVRVIEGKTRKGFAGSVKFLLQSSVSDITILINDDIKITDKLLLNKLVQPFIYEEKIGLVAGHPIPLPPKTFIERASVSSFNAYDKMKLNVKDGNSHFSCDGKVLVFSKDFARKIYFPNDLSEMGNTDTFMYFSCIKNGYKFKFVNHAIVYGRLPQTMSDLIKFQIRNNSDKYVLRKRFGKIVDEDFVKPRFVIWKNMLIEFIKNPAGSLFIFLIGFYIAKEAKQYSKNLNPKWEVISTSKKL